MIQFHEIPGNSFWKHVTRHFLCGSVLRKKKKREEEKALLSVPPSDITYSFSLLIIKNKK